MRAVLAERRRSHGQLERIFEQFLPSDGLLDTTRYGFVIESLRDFIAEQCTLQQPDAECAPRIADS